MLQFHERRPERAASSHSRGSLSHISRDRGIAKCWGGTKTCHGRCASWWLPNLRVPRLVEGVWIGIMRLFFCVPPFGLHFCSQSRNLAPNSRDELKSTRNSGCRARLQRRSCSVLMGTAPRPHGRFHSHSSMKTMAYVHMFQQVCSNIETHIRGNLHMHF